MIEELIAIEQLERIQRLIQNGNTDLALAHIQASLEERKRRVTRFEEEMDNVPI
jgi:hypothetical protein